MFKKTAVTGQVTRRICKREPPIALKSVFKALTCVSLKAFLFIQRQSRRISELTQSFKTEGYLRCLYAKVKGKVFGVLRIKFITLTCIIANSGGFVGK